MATKYERIYSEIKNDLIETKEQYDINDSSAFGHLMLKMKFGLNDEDANECLTDGFDDNGIDAIYIENNKTAHFFQFKFPESEAKIKNGVKEDEILKLENGFECFVSADEDFNTLIWNDFLLDKRNEFLKLDIFDFKLWIIRFSNQPVSTRIEKKMINFLNKYKQQTGNNIDVEYLLADECVNLYEANIKNIYPDFKLKYKKILSPFSDSKSSVNSAFVSLKEIYECFYSLQDKVYEGNVRYLSPNSKINDGIRETILRNPENFHLLNNGITIVCNDCNDNTAQGCLNIKNGTIINGAQTVGTIISTLKDIDCLEKYEDSFVFVKIVSFSNDTQLINDMVYTLNTQNKMKSSYTISNDVIVKKIQRKINRETDYFLEIKSNEFNFEKSKNNNFNKLSKNKIDIETFIQAFVAFYNISDLASVAKNNKSMLFESENISKIINELTFENSILSYEVYLKLMNIIKTYRSYRKDHNKREIFSVLNVSETEIDEYKFLNTGNIIILFTLGILFSKKEIDPKTHILETIMYLKDYFKGKSNISNATKLKETFDDIKEKIEAGNIKSYNI